MPIHLPRLESSNSLTFCILSQSARQFAVALEFFHTQLQHASRIALEQKPLALPRPSQAARLEARRLF